MSVVIPIYRGILREKTIEDNIQSKNDKQHNPDSRLNYRFKTQVYYLRRSASARCREGDWCRCSTQIASCLKTLKVKLTAAMSDGRH